MITYNTEARVKLLRFLSMNREKVYSVPEIVEALRGEVAASTIYRLVKKLLQEEKIRSVPQKNSRLTLYQYVAQGACQLHLHLRCMCCGVMIHVDDDISERVYREIIERNRFYINRSQTLLLGLCDCCREEEVLC